MSRMRSKCKSDLADVCASHICISLQLDMYAELAPYGFIMNSKMLVAAMPPNAFAKINTSQCSTEGDVPLHLWSSQHTITGPIAINRSDRPTAGDILDKDPSLKKSPRSTE